MTLLDMPPLLAVSNGNDSAMADTKLCSECPAGFVAGTDGAYLGFCEFVLRIALAAFPQPIRIGVAQILTWRDIFEIIWTRVCFVSILVVDLRITRSWANKCLGNE